MTVGIVCPGCDAARAPAKRIADPGPPQTETVPGLQRTVTLRFTLRCAGTREAPTCGCAKRPWRRCPCFRRVIYRERCNCNVSSVSAAFAHPGGGETSDQQQEPDQAGKHRQHADAAHHARLARAQSEPIVTVVGLARA